MSAFPLREFASTAQASVDSGPQFPNEPTSIEETGLGMGFIADLVLKVIYFNGTITAQRISEQTCLPYLNVIDKVLQFLKMSEYVDIVGAEQGFGERAYQYVITLQGSRKVNEVLDRSQYAGAAPVPLAAYIEMVNRQSIGGMTINQQRIREAFKDLVVNDEMLDKIGPAANSARSLFLYGPPGNGKTTIAEGISRIMGGSVMLPYAVEIDGQVIKLYDPLNHSILTKPEMRHDDVPAPFGAVATTMPPAPDRRWLHCKRPRVMVGGELILEQLELIFDPISKVYEAPYQMKANGGLFLIDDFGRQRCRPEELLNRWIVPLEKKIDFLALQTGKKIEIPFDVLIVFSTNLDPKGLVDDAFLRRIRHKIEVANPTPNEYRDIFRIVCKSKGVPYSDDGLRYLIQEHYFKVNRELRCCHPRDLLDQVLDEAKYRGQPPQMNKDLLDRACEAYFVKM
ncbi:ATP-binding protein [Herpetosiphon giganteus]|uniref:ATP-binding protein n=1 Tax=Herpetosiphon giganteus TaxID=2029754 RepID=UPI00195EACC7|nr:ATP-binding protein [Herpetosiphon giganteus]MBM7842631.1 putative ATPase with chaperone activity [Herpetosiphon giganteus]